jgi:hypothetical protein
MFLDLQEDKGFITKAEGGRNYVESLSMLDGMLRQDKVKKLQQKILEMITS